MIKLISRTVDNSVPIETFPAMEGNVERGMGLAFSSGQLKPAFETEKIEFIAEETKEAKAGEMIKVTRVVADGTYESELAEAVDSIAPGDVFLLSNSLVGTPDASGHCKILYAEGKSAGSKVRFNII